MNALLIDIRCDADYYTGSGADKVRALPLDEKPSSSRGYWFFAVYIFTGEVLSSGPPLFLEFAVEHNGGTMGEALHLLCDLCDLAEPPLPVDAIMGVN